MANEATIKALVTDLVGKHKREDLYLSANDLRPWLSCFYDIGRLIFTLEQQGPLDKTCLQLLSSCLTMAFKNVLPDRFSPENLLQLKDYAHPDACILDLARLKPVNRLGWHGRMPSNFHIRLLPKLREIAESIFRNAYSIPLPDSNTGIEFLKEYQLEKAFINNINVALSKFGEGFCFKGSQYEVISGNRKYRYDLLFYHAVLKCYIIVEIKRGSFKPDYVDKMVRYLQCASKVLNKTDDHPPIGIFLCREMDEKEVESTLEGFDYPIGVATYWF